MPLLLEASSLAALPLCRRKWIDFLPLHENLCIVGDRGIVAQSDVERVVWTLGDGLLDGDGLPDLRKLLPMLRDGRVAERLPEGYGPEEQSLRDWHEEMYTLSRTDRALLLLLERACGNDMERSARDDSNRPPKDAGGARPGWFTAVLAMIAQGARARSARASTPVRRRPGDASRMHVRVCSDSSTSSSSHDSSPPAPPERREAGATAEQPVNKGKKEESETCEAALRESADEVRA